MSEQKGRGDLVRTIRHGEPKIIYPPNQQQRKAMTTEKWSHVDFDSIPNPAMRQGLETYLDHGQLPGNFLTALLRNDLRDFYARADETNMHLGLSWVRWMHNEFPGNAWGSKEAVEKWCAQVQAEAEKHETEEQA